MNSNKYARETPLPSFVATPPTRSQRRFLIDNGVSLDRVDRLSFGGAAMLVAELVIFKNLDYVVGGGEDVHE